MRWIYCVRVLKSRHSRKHRNERFHVKRASNRPFYRYGGHNEFIRFKEYYGMPRGHEHDPIYSLSIYARAFRANFSLSFPRKRLLWEKKIVVPCLDVIMVALFPRNIQWSSRFAQKVSVNTERVSAGYPIILLKSNKFNMAAVSVERSIDKANILYSGYQTRNKEDEKRTLPSLK